MKKIYLFIFVLFSVFSIQAQNFEKNILSDSLFIEPSSYCSEENVSYAYTIAYGEVGHLIKIKNGNTYEFINDVPFELKKYINYRMEMYDGNCYFLLDDKVEVYKADGTWELSFITDQLSSKPYKMLKTGTLIYLVEQNAFDYFDGSSWHSYAVDGRPVYNSSIFIQKYANKVYFQVKNGLYCFDGSTLNLLIENTSLYDFSIFEDKIYLLNGISYNNLEVHNLDGSLDSDIRFSMSISGERMLNMHDTLYILNTYNIDKLLAIKDTEIKRVYYLSKGYGGGEKMPIYKDVLLFSEHKLVNVDLSKYDDFGTFQPKQTYRNLDINQVDAYYMHRGQMFWDGEGLAKYEVPKGSGKTSIFAGGLWISAKDSKDSIHSASVRYSQNQKYNFFPGPLRTRGTNKATTDTAYSRKFDHIWKVSRAEILLHQMHYQDADYIIPEDIATWPAHGDLNDDYAGNLAPFVDVDGNGYYDPTKGDYPDIKGDMSLYWIFNDNLAKHEETKERALGVEVHAQAYAYTCDTLKDADTIVNYTTFIDYKIINRSDTTYKDFSIGYWTASDLGSAIDDYFGTNVELNSMYFYNGKDSDGDGTANTYGENPPAQFSTFLDAPLAEEADGIDNNNDGTIDEEGEKALLSTALYFYNRASNSAMTDPQIGRDYYNYMHAHWKDGRPLTFGGTGYDTDGGDSARYMFPGTSDPWNNGTYGVDPDYPYVGGWCEEEEENPPGDRRGVMSSGTFTVHPGDELNFTIAFVWSRGNDGAISSVTKGFVDVARITEMYNKGMLHGCDMENVSVQNIKEKQVVQVYPNPAIDKILVANVALDTKYQITNLKGQVVKEGLLLSATLDISSLSKGAYIIKFVTENNTERTAKFVKVE